MKKLLCILIVLGLVLSLNSAFAKKKDLVRPGDIPLGEYDWFKFQCVVYKHPNGVGIVIAERKKEKIRADSELFSGVFYLVFRESRAHKVIAVENGRIQKVDTVFEKQCVQAAGYVSEDAKKEIKKAVRDKGDPFIKEYILPDKLEFRIFAVM